MKYKLFPDPFFNCFIQPSPPPITKLKSLHGVKFPHKNGPIPLWLDPHVITSKSHQNPINMKSMIRQHTNILRTARSPRKT